jgi:hypothetical protein
VTTELTSPGLLLPTLTDADIVASPGERQPGSWAGGPSAVWANGQVYLAYRLRRPIGQGRGFRNVVAVSPDGVAFREIAHVERDRFGAESLERPALVVTPDGRWRLYVSCATQGTKHWRVDLLEADSPEGLATAVPITVLPGSAEFGVKDPVIVHDGGRWHLWASVHPLERWDDADRMTTEYATSHDGVSWTWHGTALAGRPGEWDARGVRVSSVLIDDSTITATYDGRATAAENWEEATGVATATRGADGRFGSLTAVAGPPLRSRSSLGGLRYLCAVRLPDARLRVYYEVTCEDGAHELHTELLGSPRRSAPPFRA